MVRVRDMAENATPDRRPAHSRAEMAARNCARAITATLPLHSRVKSRCHPTGSRVSRVKSRQRSMLV